MIEAGAAVAAVAGYGGVFIAQGRC